MENYISQIDKMTQDFCCLSPAKGFEDYYLDKAIKLKVQRNELASILDSGIDMEEKIKEIFENVKKICN